MIILDACVLIAHFTCGDAHHQRARRLLAATDGIPLAASALTVAEVLVGPTRAGRGPEMAAALARLGVRSLDLPGDAAARLAELRAVTGLKMPDSWVLLAAEAHAASLATFDGRLARAAEQRGVIIQHMPETR